MKKHAKWILSLFMATTMTASLAACNTDKNVTVSFVTGTNQTISSVSKEVNEPYGDLPTPTRENYTFLGWFTDENNGEKITDIAEVSIKKNHSLYARWVYALPGKIDATNSTYIIDENGTLWAWGSNYYGNLGDGTTEDRLSPVQIMPEIKFSQVSTGGNTTHAIDIDGNLWAWGNNVSGFLGDGTEEERLSPVQIMPGTKFSRINSGSHVLAIDIDGNLWSWGSNSYGVIGDGTMSGLLENNDRPTPIHIIKGTKFKEISSGNHVLALDVNGNLWSWGSNTNGQLGNGTVNPNPLEGDPNPKRIMQGRVFSQISSGANQSLAIDTNGNLFAWGENTNGQLGDGTVIDKSSPVQVMKGTKFVRISASGISFLAIDENGKLWACGSNKYGYLGNGTTENQTLPIQIMQNNIISDIVATSHCFVIDKDGNYWAWGRNWKGQLGDGTTEDRLSPVQIYLGKS